MSHIEFGLTDEAVQRAEAAIDYALAIKTEDDIVMDLSETWPGESEAEDFRLPYDEADGDARSIEADRDRSVDEIDNAEARHDRCYSLLVIVTQVIDDVITISYSSERRNDRDYHSVQLLQIPSHPPFLIFVPSETTEKGYRLCIPKYLKPETYSCTSRLWILEQLEIGDDINQPDTGRAEDFSVAVSTGGSFQAQLGQCRTSYALRAKTRLLGLTPPPMGKAARLLLTK